MVLIFIQSPPSGANRLTAERASRGTSFIQSPPSGANLWRCADHGSLQIGGGFLVLPGAGSAEEGAAGPSVPEKANSVASGASSTGAATRKRTLDELQDAVEELSERQSLAEGLGQPGAKPTEPTPKRPLTFVSIPNKVSPCLSCRSRVGTIHYGPLISLGLILSKPI